MSVHIKRLLYSLNVTPFGEGRIAPNALVKFSFDIALRLSCRSIDNSDFTINLATLEEKLTPSRIKSHPFYEYLANVIALTKSPSLYTGFTIVVQFSNDTTVTKAHTSSNKLRHIKPVLVPVLIPNHTFCSTDKQPNVFCKYVITVNRKGYLSELNYQASTAPAHPCVPLFTRDLRKMTATLPVCSHTRAVPFTSNTRFTELKYNELWSLLPSLKTQIELQTWLNSVCALSPDLEALRNILKCYLTKDHLTPLQDAEAYQLFLGPVKAKRDSFEISISNHLRTKPDRAYVKWTPIIIRKKLPPTASVEMRRRYRQGMKNNTLTPTSQLSDSTLFNTLVGFLSSTVNIQTLESTLTSHLYTSKTIPEIFADSDFWLKAISVPAAMDFFRAYLAAYPLSETASHKISTHTEESLVSALV